MLKNILTVLRKLASAAMNFLIVYFETIAVPMSWAMGGTIMFTMYTELSNIFNGAVCLLVGLWQLGCIFTGRELPLSPPSPASSTCGITAASSIRQNKRPSGCKKETSGKNARFFDIPAKNYR